MGRWSDSSVKVESLSLIFSNEFAKIFWFKKAFETFLFRKVIFFINIMQFLNYKYFK